MKKIVKKMKGKKVLSLLLAVIMVLSVASPAFSPLMGIIAKAATGDTIELAFDNIFVFEQWANHQSFAALNATNGALIDDDTTLVADIAAGSFTLTNSISDPICTSFSMATADTHYTIPVEENTTYNFSYNLSGTTTSVYVYVFYYDIDGNYFKLDVSPETSFIFTTPENTGYIGVRFDNNIGSSTATFSDIKICKSTTVEYSETPTRKAYTAGTGYYTDLPTPTKDGWFFMGWYTGENGSGELVTADTEVFGSSVTVYSMWEADVTALSIDTEPTKKSYTLGEKVDTTDLVLKGTLVDGSTITIDSGFRCSPENVDTVGTQTITVNYGTKSVTFDVNVVSHIDKTVTVAGVEQTVPVANNTYTLNHTASEAFNRYELTYTSDSYVKGTITMGNVSEDFFLEPSPSSGNGSFVSYIDNFLNGKTQTNIATIKFTCLNKENGTFELLSVATDYIAAPDSEMQYYENGEYKVGIDLGMGGTLSYLQDLINNPVAADYSDTTGTKVDFEENITDIADAEGVAREVNLINTFDKGRLVQQSYYGTDQYPFDLGSYDGNDWRYNPVQGGNAPVYADDDTTVLKGDEASKIVDYSITETEIYVKTRPLDWGKNSEDYPDSYNTPSYMESRYVFEDGMIKTYCRFVDYSGYPASTYKQELPAFYCVEPLNYLAYSTGGDAWSSDNKITYKTDLDYWGKNGVNPNYTCNENWAAFMAGDDPGSYGIGVYSADVSNFVAGVFPDKETDYIVNDPNIENNHAKTIDPSSEVYTSYMAPSENMKFESYSPFEYSYYITTGTARQIRADFQTLAGVVVPEEIKECTIAVPETIYMTPSDSTSVSGQYFVNNYVNGEGEVSISAENSTLGSISVYSPGSTSIKFDVTAVKGGIGDPVIGGSSVDANSSYEGSEWAHSLISGAYGTGAAQDWFRFDMLNLFINGAGITAGNTALIEWAVTVYYGENDTTGVTYYAYSTLYSPHRSVGAVSEARRTSSYNNEISSWISGINGLPGGWSPITSGEGDKTGAGYFKYDPLWNALNTSGSSESVDDYVTIDANNLYVESKGTDGADGSRAVGYLGSLTIDSSRYTNINQIPNLKIGGDVLRVNGGAADSLHEYDAWYVIGDASYTIGSGYSDRPSGWTVFDTVGNEPKKTSRDTVVPSYLVSDINGKYIHTASQGECNNWGVTYSNACASVICYTVDKSTLRELVLECTGLNEANYTTASWASFKTALQNAAQALGNPSNSDVDTTYEALVAARDALQTNVYLNANGGSISPESFVVTIGKETTASADVSTYIPTRTGYTFTGWTAIEGATIGGTTETINVGFNQTLYAVWKANKYNVTFDNLIDLDAWKELTPDNATATFTDTAITLTSNEGVGEGTFTSHEFPVTAGSDYEINIDFEGDGWDVYIFFRSETVVGNGIEFNDNATRRYSSNGSTGVDPENAVFTAPTGATKAAIRIDANGASNTVTFSNIRVWEDTGISVSPVNKYAEYGSVYGNLPTPVKDNQGFKGWKIKGTETTVNESTIMDVAGTVELVSEWEDVVYTVNFSANGAADVEIPNICLGQTITTFVLPQGPSCEDLEFLGWSTNQYATKAEYKAGQTINVKSLELEADANTNGYKTVIHAVWKLKPTVFKNDTVVADFGIVVPVQPRSNDNNDILGYHLTKKDDGTGFAGTLEYGVAGVGETPSVDEKTYKGLYGNFNVYYSGETETEYIAYTPTTTMKGPDTVSYCGQITYYDGTLSDVLTNTITVVPASNMYYEESFAATIKGDTNTSTLVDWSEKGTPVLPWQDFNGTGDIYGYDASYEGVSSTFSDGTFYKTEVYSANDEANNQFKRSETAVFEFYGTGFDLVSACGTTTGVQAVKVSKDGENIKNYVIDTYLSDTTMMTSGDDEKSLLHQVPILSYRGDSVDATYTVEVTALFLKSSGAVKGNAALTFSSGVASDGTNVNIASTSATEQVVEELEELGLGDMCDNLEMRWMDDDSVLNGGLGAEKDSVISGSANVYFSDATETTTEKTPLTSYIDGFRVYNNGGEDYYKESEQNPTYYNIVSDIGQGELSGSFTEIESDNYTSIFGSDFVYDDYWNSDNPKNEIYLAEGQAIAFKFTAEYAGTNAGVMLGMRAVKGSVTAEVTSTNDGTETVTPKVSSSMEMYYDISSAAYVSGSTGEVTVIVVNPDDNDSNTNNILAVNNLKLVNGKLNSSGTGETPTGSNDVVGGSSSVPEAVVPVTPDSTENDAVEGDIPNENVPENDETDTTTPETDVEDNTEEDADNSVTTMFPGMPVSIASFLELLFEFLGRLVSSLGF